MTLPPLSLAVDFNVKYCDHAGLPEQLQSNRVASFGVLGAVNVNVYSPGSDSFILMFSFKTYNNLQSHPVVS